MMTDDNHSSIEEADIKETDSIQKDIYNEIIALKDLFLRRLMDDKVKTVAISQLKENIDTMKKQLDEKAIVSIVRDIILVCDRIDSQDEIDDLTLSVREELEEILARREFFVMEDLEIFDPSIHNAVFTEITTEPEMDKHIAKVIRNGYLFRDQVFRAADVVVAVYKAEQEG